MVTRRDTAKIGIDVAATAAKYGIKAASCGVRLCGKVATTTLGMAGKMAGVFANDGLGTPIADGFGKGFNKGISIVTKTVEKQSSKFIDYLANKAKSRI